MFIKFSWLIIKATLKMNNKEIQEQLMKGYFMQATKELLKGEGLKSLNVRNIAQQAGYSFATLYNYFKDVKELVFLCVEDFQKECAAEITQKVNGIPSGPEKIKAITKAYMAYFVQYPSVFNLFFIEKLGDIGQKQPTANLIFTFLDRLTAMPPLNSGTRRRLITRQASRAGGRVPEQLLDVLTRVDHVEWGN